MSTKQQFMVKRTLFGNYILMTRHWIPALTPGCWQWSKWRKVRDLEDVAEVIRKLRDK